MSDSKVKSVFKAMWQTFDAYRLRRLETSWFMVTRDEQKQRLRALTTLITELEKIKAVSIQATGIGEGLIERVIEGDWDQVQAYHDDLVAAFNEPSPSETQWEGYQEHQEKHRALWEGFLTAAQTAIAESKRVAPGTRRGGN